MVFVPSNTTYHGFEPRKIEGVRKSVIINYVTNEWHAREQLAFPDHPIRNTAEVAAPGACARSSAATPAAIQLPQDAVSAPQWRERMAEAFSPLVGEFWRLHRCRAARSVVDCENLQAATRPTRPRSTRLSRIQSTGADPSQSNFQFPGSMVAMVSFDRGVQLQPTFNHECAPCVEAERQGEKRALI